MLLINPDPVSQPNAARDNLHVKKIYFKIFNLFNTYIQIFILIPICFGTKLKYVINNLILIKLFEI